MTVSDLPSVLSRPVRPARSESLMRRLRALSAAVTLRLASAAQRVPPVRRDPGELVGRDVERWLEMMLRHRL